MARRIGPIRDAAMSMGCDRDGYAFQGEDSPLRPRDGGFARPIGEIVAFMVERLAAAQLAGHAALRASAGPDVAAPGAMIECGPVFALARACNRGDVLHS